ncbi:hypothetical protein [Clostridium sulfidigenes]|uniref:hypothetical protein n=1 Tax=Clostridium sulfidigenes TaxID=318464 RepID=UPI003F8A482C
MSQGEANTLKFVQDIDSKEITLEENDFDNSPVFNGIFKEYEKVVVRSLITSFGLDALLIADRRGGDVDTINTVRDSSVTDYADKKNQASYENRGEYNSDSYHKHKNYMATNKKISEQKKNGNLEDAYTGNKVNQNANIDLDHTISAKEIHDDPGRVLAGLSGEDLANTDTNLNATDRSINRSKKAKSSEEFLKKLDEDSQQRREKINELKVKKNLTEKEQKELNKLEKLESVDTQRLKEKDTEARKAYEKEIAYTYYTSSKFLKSTAKASLKKGTQMGLRQCLGLVLTEVWFTVKEEFPEIVSKMKNNFELPQFLKEIANTIKKAFNGIIAKYKEVISAFKDGMLAGILSSISSTLTNIFFTTAKCVGKILRESWASIVEAVKILVFNPDNLPFGEMLRAVAKIIATSVSVICGSLVQEAISKMNPIKVPIIADVLPSFIGCMVTGIMTVSMLYFLDHSKIVQKIVDYANQLKSEFDYKLEYFREVNKKLTIYVSNLASIDYVTLEKEIVNLKNINARLQLASTIEELNFTLHQVLLERNIKLPYESLDDFMNDKDSILII